MDQAAELRRRYWLLEEGVHFLNHGSYGACPRPVLAAQQVWRERMEAQPVCFLGRDLPVLLREAAAELAAFMGARGDDLAFVENATTGINAVLRSYPWQKGDELVLSAHAYPAIKAAATFVAHRYGVVVREFAFPFPLADAGQIVQGFRSALSSRTRMALLDHVASPLSIIYPLPELLEMCRAQGVATLVDGAHAPGMLALDIGALGADWYVGNCHKWLFAPKGCAFLWASPRAGDFLQPTTISLRMEEGFPKCFDWVGTRDPTPWLSVTAALEFYREMGGAAIPGRLHGDLLASASRLCRAWDVELPAPAEMFGAMATLPLPLDMEAIRPNADALHDALRERYRIEVPVLAVAGRLWLRVSQQLYTTEEDIAALERAVIELRS